MMRRLVTVLPVLLSVVAVFSCHKGLPPGVLAQKEIAAADGGRVETSDGKLVIDIPANALSANATVTVTAVDSPPAYPGFDFLAPLGTCYSIELGGATIDDSITLSVDVEGLPSGATASLACFDTSFACWAFTGGDMDSAGGWVSVRTTHLSDWWTFYFLSPTISRKILSVPYYSQRGLEWCAPTSMAMEMKYCGFDHEYHEAAAAMGLAPDEGPNAILEVIRSQMLPAYYAMTGSAPYRFLFLDAASILLVPTVIGNLVQVDAASALASSEARHVVEVTGWSADSVWFHDPSGVLGFGEIGARCSWLDFFLKTVGMPSWVIVDAFQLPPAPDENRRGTIELYSAAFSPSGACRLTMDGKDHPCGYYYADWGENFPDDPNEDGLNLENMVRATDTMLLTCLLFNNTMDDKVYHITTKLCDRAAGTVVGTLADTFVSLDADSQRYVRIYDAENPYYPSELSPGRYSFRVYLECVGVMQDSFNVHFNLAVRGGGDNDPPDTPGMPTGPASGQIGVTYDFAVSTNDPDGDQVQYQFDWGDGTQSNWSSLVPSGTGVQMSNAWGTAGTYAVKARAKDEHGATSGWSEALPVAISGGGQSWARAFGGSGNDYGAAVQQMSDGGYVVAGTFSGATGYDAYLVRTNLDGDTLWTRTFDRSDWDWGWSCQMTAGGGVVIAGETDDSQTGNCYLIKADASGATLWTRALGGSDDDDAWSVIETSDGGYLLAGRTNSFGAGSYDAYLVRTDIDGDTLWTRTYGDAGDDYASSVQQTTDGGFVFVGATNSRGAGVYDVYLVRVDVDGDTLWTRTIGGSDSDRGECIRVTGDGGFIIAGLTSSFGAGGYDVYLVRVDAAGTVLWERTYGGAGYDRGTSVWQTSDGEFVVAGVTQSFGAGQDDVYLLRVDIDGDTLWTRTYGGDGSDFGADVRQTADGGFIIAGTTESSGAGGLDAWLIKTDENGN